MHPMQLHLTTVPISQMCLCNIHNAHLWGKMQKHEIAHISELIFSKLRNFVQEKITPILHNFSVYNDRFSPQNDSCQTIFNARCVSIKIPKCIWNQQVWQSCVFTSNIFYIKKNFAHWFESVYCLSQIIPMTIVHHWFRKCANAILWQTIAIN